MRQILQRNVQDMVFCEGHEFLDRDLAVLEDGVYFLLKLRIRFVLLDQFFYRCRCAFLLFLLYHSDYFPFFKSL